MGGAASHGSERARPRLAVLGSRGIPARYGGFETFAEALAVGLVARGFEVTVYGERRPEPQPREHRGVRLVHLARPPLGPAGTLLFDLACLRHARRAHEVVYMLGYGAGAFLGLGRRPGNEVWVNMDGREWRRAKWSAPARLWLRRMERAALAQADRIVFDCAAVREEVVPPQAPERERTTVIAYGAERQLTPDPNVLGDLGLAPGGFDLCLARIEPENHVLEIVRAATRGARPLLVVGDIERARDYGRRCRAAAGPAVRFLGALHDAPVLARLRGAARAVLHGHSVGGTNPALLEAMAAGALVLAHDNPYNREVLGPHGLFWSDENGLAQALGALDGLTAIRRGELTCGAQARIAAHYTWEQVVEAYAALLEPRTTALAATSSERRPGPPAALPARAPQATPEAHR